MEKAEPREKGVGVQGPACSPRPLVDEGTEGRGRKRGQREPGSRRWASSWCPLAWGFVELAFRGWKSINRQSGLVLGKRCFVFFF